MKYTRYMSRFFAISVMLHFTVAVLAGYFIGLPDLVRSPIRISLIEEPTEQNVDFPAGKIADLPEMEEGEKPEEADFLAALDSIASLPGEEESEKRAELSLPPKETKEPNIAEKDKTISTYPPDPFGKPYLPSEKKKENTLKLKSEETIRKSEPKQEPELKKAEDNLFIIENKNRFLESDQIDLFVKNNPNSVYETDNEAIVSLNTKKFEYADYFSEIRKAVEYVWNYPPEAIMNGVGGMTLLRFTLLRDGELAEIKVVKPSGVKTLDEASVEAVRKAAPFKPFPETLTKERIHLVGNFIYQPVFNPVYVDR